MKLSPISHNIYHNNSQNQSFGKIVMTKEERDAIKKSPMKDSEKELFFNAYRRIRKGLDELPCDVTFKYVPEQKGDSIWKQCFNNGKEPEPDRLDVDMVIYDKFTKAPFTFAFDILPRIRRGDTTAKIANYILKRTTYMNNALDFHDSGYYPKYIYLGEPPEDIK